MHFYDHNSNSFKRFCKKTTLFVEIPVHRRMLKRTAVPSCNLPSSNKAKYDCALRQKKRCDARNSKIMKPFKQGQKNLIRLSPKKHLIRKKFKYKLERTTSKKTISKTAAKEG